jgi:hypothetical protein
MMVGINELTDKTKSKSLGYFHHYQKYSWTCDHCLE